MGQAATLIRGADDYYASSAVEASAVASADPAYLYSALIYNNNASTRYFQLFDSATVPADSTVPILTVAVPAGSTGAFDFGDAGIPFFSGIAVCNSSTDVTKTVGAADSLFYVAFRKTH